MGTNGQDTHPGRSGREVRGHANARAGIVPRAPHKGCASRRSRVADPRGFRRNARESRAGAEGKGEVTDREAPRKSGNAGDISAGVP